MGYRVSYEQADGLLKTWQEQYRVYAPKRFAGRGWRPGTDMIRYGEIQSFRDVAYTEQSHFSPKDVVAPIMQTMLSFTADEVKVSSIDDKGILLLARPCDIHGIQRLDKIFLENGGQADFYYQRYREKIKIIMIECREGWEHCFACQWAPIGPMRTAWLFVLTLMVCSLRFGMKILSILLLVCRQ